MDDKRNQESRHDYLSFITNIVILIFVVVNGGLLTYMAFTLYQARMDAIHDERFDEAPPNEAILQRAEDAVNQADQLLGFLEGAAVLIALALGAGALVGYRNTREIRADLRQEQDELRKRSEDIRKEQENRSERIDKLLNEGNKLYGEMQQYLPQLENATNLVSEIENIRRQINDQVQQELLKAQNNANALIQATQQLNLKNYEEAYIYTLRVLENMPSNSQALYVAGWLEMQYIPGKLELSIEHLNKAIEQDKDNATYQAALGVAMKRAGQNAAKAGDLDKRNHDYWEAEQLLKSALDRSPNLIDLNRESFWGPLGGIYRD
ncbi:MAG: tetratricopeptide repeat protein, partial [Anaerolineales bacterium]